MVKRLICILCVFVLCFSCAAADGQTPAARRYDFDLTFSLNPDAFPARSRSRARGYAELLDRLELRGDIVICEETQSFDINAALFFRDKPEVSIPFRFYGTPSLLFLTSPIIGNETLLFNMIGLAEFAIKVRKSLDTPLPALALLYPVVYQHNLWNVWKTWDQYTGPNDASREISAERISQLADAWSELLDNDNMLNIWMTALVSVSSAPEAVWAELSAVPSYLKEFVAAGKPLSVEIGNGTETWKNAAGTTLFSSEKADGSVNWSLTLPADENRYASALSCSAKEKDGAFSFTLDGSMIRSRSVLPQEAPEESSGAAAGSGEEEEEFDEIDSPLTGSAEEEEYDEVDSPLTGSEEEEEYDEIDFPLTGSAEKEENDEADPPLTGSEDRSETGTESREEESYDDEEDSQWPETMLLLSASGDSIPTAFPVDASFSLAASIKGALYPNFDVSVRGTSGKDGSVSVSVSLPQEGAGSEAALSFGGTIVPGDAVETAPDFNYTPDQLYGTYNFFSFSEYYVAKFKNAVTEPLVKGLLDFVAEAPTAACQSLLDDLTDSGILTMMSDQ